MLKTKIRSILHNKALLAVFLVVALSIGAVTVAWALSIGTYDQCSNDDGDGYASGDTGCRWINGNLQSNNSTYTEGDATVQRLWLTDLVPGSHAHRHPQVRDDQGRQARLRLPDHLGLVGGLDHRCRPLPGHHRLRRRLQRETTLPIPEDPNVPGTASSRAPRVTASSSCAAAP